MPDDEAGAAVVEIASGFVDNEKFRASQKGTGQGGALDFTDAELRRTVIKTGAETEAFEQASGQFIRLGKRTHQGRQENIVEQVQPRQQMKLLEEAADVFRPPIGPRFGTEGIRIFATKKDLPIARAQEAADRRQGGGFAAAARAEQGDEAAGRELEIEAAQDLQETVAVAKLGDLQRAKIGPIRPIRPIGLIWIS